MPEEMNTTNNGGDGGMMMDGSEEKNSPAGKIIAIVLAVLIIAGAIYAWSRKAPEKEEANEATTEQGTQTEQPGTTAGNMPDTKVATTTGERSSPQSAPPTTTNQTGETTAPAQTPAASTTVITHTDSGYSPRTPTVKKGATVTFKNESNNAMWPASAFHPTHTVYPGSDLAKCGTTEQTGIFDACRALEKGEQWSFKFDNVGSWKYHDHLEPSHSGTIVVTE